MVLYDISLWLVFKIKFELFCFTQSLVVVRLRVSRLFKKIFNHSNFKSVVLFKNKFKKESLYFKVIDLKYFRIKLNCKLTNKIYPSQFI